MHEPVDLRQVKWKDWSADPAGDAVRLAQETVSLVGDGRLRDASRALAELTEVIWTQRSDTAVGPVERACAHMLKQLSGVQTERRDLFLRAGCVVVFLRGHDESFLEGIEDVLQLRPAQPGVIAGDRWIEEAALYRARILGRLGRLAEAVEAASSLLDVVSGDMSGELTWIGFEAGFERCRGLHLREMWPEAVEACREFKQRWIKEPHLPSRQRELLSTTMWLEAWSSVQMSEWRWGFAGGPASRLLDELLEWLRQQPEISFRLALGRRLADRFHWPADLEGMVAALDELTHTLESVGDRPLIMQTGELVLENAGSLLQIDAADSEQLRGSLVEVLRSDLVLRSSAEVGVSDALVDRIERAATSLGRLSALLSGYEDDEARELRAGIMMRQAGALGLLGKADEVERLVQELIDLGPPTTGACDRVISEASNLEAQGATPDLGNVLGALQLRAAVSAARGDSAAAASDYQELVRRFNGVDEPAIQPAVELARIFLAELDNEHTLLPRDAESNEPLVCGIIDEARERWPGSED